MYNESKLTKPLAIQLLDEGDNVCKTADVRLQLARDVKLKVIMNVGFVNLTFIYSYNL